VEGLVDGVRLHVASFSLAESIPTTGPTRHVGSEPVTSADLLISA
jgi:hypothetical protein